MDIKARLEQDMKEAMKAREAGKTKLSAIRMARASIKNAEIEKGHPLDDPETAAVIMREIKQRRESLAEYERAGREDTVSTILEEIAALQEYLPQQLGDEELEREIRKIIEETGAAGPGDLGKVMGPAMLRLKGRAEGSLVNQVVRRLLSR